MFQVLDSHVYPVATVSESTKDISSLQVVLLDSTTLEIFNFYF